MTMQSKHYDGKNHKNDDLGKLESTQKDVLKYICFDFLNKMFYNTTKIMLILNSFCIERF